MHRAKSILLPALLSLLGAFTLGGQGLANDIDAALSTKGQSPTLAQTEENVRAGLRSIPEAIRKKIFDAGVKILVVPTQTLAGNNVAWSHEGNWAGLSNPKNIYITEHAGRFELSNRTVGVIKHEMGHELDFHSGNPSQSQEFKNALRADIAAMPGREFASRQIWENTDKKNRELFANLVAVFSTPKVNWSNEDRAEAKNVPNVQAFMLARYPALNTLRDKEATEAKLAGGQTPPGNDKNWQAIAYYSAILQKQEDNLEALHHRARAYTNLGKNIEAAADEESALRFKMQNRGYKETAVVPNSSEAPQTWTYDEQVRSDIAWTMPQFDNRNWRTGQGGFGRYSPACKMRTKWTSPDIYIRRKILLPNVDLSNVKISAIHVNQLRVYINGELAVSSDDWYQHYRGHDILPAARRQLLPGREITLAAYCHNRDRGSACLDVGLSIFSDE